MNFLWNFFEAHVCSNRLSGISKVSLQVTAATLPNILIEINHIPEPWGQRPNKLPVCAMHITQADLYYSSLFVHSFSHTFYMPPRKSQWTNPKKKEKKSYINWWCQLSLLLVSLSKLQSKFVFVSVKNMISQKELRRKSGVSEGSKWNVFLLSVTPE